MPEQDGAPPPRTALERFPGEREADTAMPTQPGIMGTTGFGGDLPETTTDETVNEAMARERANEGGGHTKGQGAKGKRQR